MKPIFLSRIIKYTKKLRNAYLTRIQKYPLLLEKRTILIMVVVEILVGLFLIFAHLYIKNAQYIPTSTPRPEFVQKPYNITIPEIFYPQIAVIVEFRVLEQLIVIVHNVNHHIPSMWPIQMFHGRENEYLIRNSTLAPLIESGKVFLTMMNETYDKNRTNELLTTTAFWQRVRGEKILFFQIDSVMCSNSPHKITDYLRYDYVGAPWDEKWFSFNKRYRVGNGGFSLRTRSKVLALLESIPYDPKLPEDVWVAQNMHRVKGLIPPVSIAKTFAVESILYERPLAVHRFIWNRKLRLQVSSTCPEAMLIMPQRRR